MEKKQKIDTIIALISILIGVVLIILPLIGITPITKISICVFGTYTIISSIQFILTMKSKDYEGLYSAISSFMIVMAHFFWNPSESPKILALFLMAWILLMSLTKLKKADYYHDLVLENTAKSTGIVELLDYLGIDNERAIAIGNGYDDICMCDVVGTSVAVENANQILKQSATYITDTAANDGVAKILEKLCLKED